MCSANDFDITANKRIIKYGFETETFTSIYIQKHATNSGIFLRGKQELTTSKIVYLSYHALQFIANSNRFTYTLWL